MHQENTSGNGNGQSRPTPRLVINVDHLIVGIFSFLFINLLADTPLFSLVLASVSLASVEFAILSSFVIVNLLAVAVCF